MQRDEAQSAIGPRRQTDPSYWAISLRRLLRKKIGVACLTIILLMYGSGVLAPLVTPYGFNDQDLSITKQGPSFSHPFGTDRLGRDVFTRVIYGLRTTVIITVVTLVTGSLALGITMGLLAGYFGRLIDTVIMRVGEVTSAFPEIFLVLIIVSTLKPPITEWVR
ncbi:MAG: ABC transporter permease, partial [Chloroflexi bacterium]|nr:ABC transporter permease [Chloroflexota bacterium]